MTDLRHSSNGSGYLPHIDGLRGISVVLVVLYHAWPDALPGGFIGVDVFFVISGFLITRLLLQEIGEGRFSYGGFLVRRLRRLWPTFALVGAISLGLGFIVLDADGFRALAEAMIAGTLLSSNWYFYFETDYFNDTLGANFLLHTWSLSVEEQFYLVYPLVLLALATAKRALWPGVGVIWLLSFGLSVQAATASSDPADFFATHLRVWELATGALGYGLVRSGWPASVSDVARTMLAAFGLLTVFVGALFIEGGARFPGWIALMPTLGALAAIVFGGTATSTTIGRLLEYRPLVFVGLTSYALYLWHWPLLQAVRAIDPSPSDGLVALVLFVAFLASVVSYRHIETPIRRRQLLVPTSAILGVAACGSLALLATSLLVRSEDGLPGRLPSELQTILAASPDARMDHQYCDSAAMGLPDEVCLIGERSAVPDILFWGDSHLGAIRPELAQRLASENRSAWVTTWPACPPLIAVAWKNLSMAEATACFDHNDDIIDFVRAVAVSKTVLVAHWDTYAVHPQGVPGNRKAAGLQSGGGASPSLPDAIGRTLDALADKTGLTVLMDVPTHDLQVPDAVASSLRWPWLGSPNWMTRGGQLMRRDSYADVFIDASVRGDITLVDPLNTFCSADTCLAALEDRPLFYDASHLTEEGASLLLDAHPDLIAPAHSDP